MYTPDSPSQPATAYRRLPGYARDVEATGVDFVIEPLGDIATTSSGDFQPLSGADSITQSLMRRLYTPAEGYRRWVRTPSGLQEVDTDYGDSIYNYLSAPLTASALMGIEQAVKQAASHDLRIEVQSVQVQQQSSNSVAVSLLYVMKSDSQLRQLNYVLKPASDV